MIDDTEYIFEYRICFQPGSTTSFFQKKFFAPNDIKAKKHVEKVLIPEIIKTAEKKRGGKVKAIFAKKLFKIVFKGK